MEEITNDIKEEIKQEFFKENNDISESIWKTTKNGDWELFFDCDQKTDVSLSSDVHIKSFQEGTLGSTFKMGSLVITPKGIGRLIKLENELATVKFLKTEEELNFSEKEIFSE